MKKEQGFTLTELMVTVAIVAVIASIALPAYQDQIRKGRRGDGTVFLTEIRDLQERFFMENNTYTFDLTDLGYTSGAWVYSDEKLYRVRARGAGTCNLPNCYLLIARAVAGTTQVDDGHLRLWSDGRKQRRVDGVWKNGWD